ncbi:MAG TPA: Ig-like domain-containing protein [Candidatus Eisenbacteria bacterium]|jgi:hypothetical protein
MRPSAGARDVAALGAALMLAMVAGCGQGEKPALAPPARLSAQIEAVYPAARSTGVTYDTDIWVRFTEPLDPATVNERTVFFKLDTVRIPSALAYDAPTRTIRIRPLVELALRRTYTVEITPGVATAGGLALAQTYFWQFTTNGLRRLLHPIPPSGTTDESPFVALQWDVTEPLAGTIRYEFYSGADSAAVASRAAGPVRVGSQPFYVPWESWGFDRRVYWAVTAANQTTGERFEGPVWRFETLPPGLPVDVLEVPAGEWGYYRRNPPVRTVCQSSLASGPSYNNGIHWRLRETAGGLKLATARIEMLSSSGNMVPTRPVIRPVFDAWAPCSYSVTVPHVGDPELAAGTQILTSPYFRLESERLTSHIEAAARAGVVYGFSFGTTVDAGLGTPSVPGGIRLVLTYYRTPIPPSPAP